MREPTLSVLVPTYNDDHRLEITLRGLLVQRGPPFEVVVVNDGGHDATRERVLRLLRAGPRGPALVGVQYHLLEPKTADFRAAATRNLGIKHCQGSRLVFCDCDTVPAPGWLEAHSQEKEILIGLRRRISQAAVEAVEPTDVTQGWLIKNVCEEDSRTLRPALIQAWNDIPKGVNRHIVFYTCNLSAPLHTVRAIGGFDETFVGWGGEDEDLGIRLMKTGLDPYKTSALVYHLNHDTRTSGRASKRLEVTRHQSVVRVGPLPKLEPIYL